MRLKDPERLAIQNSILGKDPLAQIYLLGSRTDTSLKGGDIDLLVLSTALTLTEKIDILIEIKRQIGEQKVDLLLATPSQAQSDPFLVEVLKKAVLFSPPKSASK